MVKYIKILYEGKTKKLCFNQTDDFSTVKNKIQSIYSLSENFFLLFLPEKIVGTEKNFQNFKNSSKNFLKFQIKKNKQKKTETITESTIKNKQKQKKTEKITDSNIKNKQKQKNLKSQTINDFLEFNSDIHSPYMTIFKSEGFLKSKNFIRLKPEESWQLKKGQGYYIKKNYYSNLIAFFIPSDFEPKKSSFKIISSNVDFACLRLSPVSKCIFEDYLFLDCEKSGVANWESWKNRDLSLGGRVVVKNSDGSLSVKIYNSQESVGIIAENFTNSEKNSENKQKSRKSEQTKTKNCKFYPLIATKYKNSSGKKTYDFIVQEIANELKIEKEDIINYDLCLSSSKNSKIIGFGKEFISGPRLNNLVGVWSSLMAFMNVCAEEKVFGIPMIILNNNLESHLTPVKVKEVLKRIVWNLIDQQVGESFFSEKGFGSFEKDLGFEENERDFNRKFEKELDFEKEEGESIKEDYFEKKKIIRETSKHEICQAILSKSFEIRCFPSESTNFFQSQNTKSVLNNGIVIKTSNSYKFPTNSVTKSIIEIIAKPLEIEIQDIFDTENENQEIKDCWIKGVDLGLPILSLGNIRETVGVFDVISLNNLFNSFFESELPCVSDEFGF